MHDFAYIDETLDINLTQSYQLSIQLNLNGLSFCLYDPVQNKYVALVHRNFSYIEFNDFLNQLEDFVTNDELLRESYKSVKLMWTTSKSALIPSDIFSLENVKTQFEFTQKMDDLDELHYNHVKYIDSVSVFTIPNPIANIFSKNYTNIQFYNQQISYIEHIFSKYHSATKKIFINLHKEFFDIAVTEGSNLLLYTNFKYKTDMDLIYYIMNVFNQYQNKVSHTDVIISGLIHKKSETYLKLKEFIPHIKFDKHPEDFTYSYTFNKLPNNSFINLFNLNHCE